MNRVSAMEPLVKIDSMVENANKDAIVKANDEENPSNLKNTIIL